MRARIAFVVALGLLPACSAATNQPPGPAPLRLAGDANTITWYDLQYQSELESAYTAISQLRPSFFSTRPTFGGVSSPSRLAVYLNGAYSGDVEVLQSLRVRDIESMKYLRASDAAGRYGTFNDTDGVLLVTLRRP